MSLPEYAHGFRSDTPLTPEDVWPAGRSPLDFMDAQESSIFASAFTTRSRPLGLAGPGHRASPDLDDDAALFAETMR